MKQSNYLTAKEPEQRVAHIPPMVAPGPVSKNFYGHKFQYKNWQKDPLGEFNVSNPICELFPLYSRHNDKKNNCKQQDLPMQGFIFKILLDAGAILL